MATGTHTLNIIIRVTDKASQAAEKVKKNTEKLGKSIQGVGKIFNNFYRTLQQTLLGVGLSFLFTGMAIKRFFEGMLRGLVSSFLTVMGETSQHAQQVGRLQAAWEFLKFKIMSALVQSGIWDKVIDKLQEIIDLTIEWVDDHPKATANIVKWIAVLAVVGTVAMVAGQVMLGLLGVLGLIWGALKVIGFAFKLLFMPMHPVIAFLLIVLYFLTIWSVKLGGFGELWKAVWNGIEKIGYKVIDGIYSKLEDIFMLGWKIANKMGWDGLADNMWDAANAAGKARSVLEKKFVEGQDEPKYGWARDDSSFWKFVLAPEMPGAQQENPPAWVSMIQRFTDSFTGSGGEQNPLNNLLGLSLPTDYTSMYGTPSDDREEGTKSFMDSVNSVVGDLDLSGQSFNTAVEDFGNLINKLTTEGITVKIEDNTGSPQSG